MSKKHIVRIARQLRRDSTPAEKLMWANLRNRKIDGYKFLRQHPIEIGGSSSNPEFFVADFYCSEKKLVIELDGKYHDFQKYLDKERDSILKELGITTIRFKNEELSDVSAVLWKIRKILTHPPSPSLQSREGVTEQSEVGGELNGIGTDLKEVRKILTHPSSPSLQRRVGVTEQLQVGGELAILILAAGSSSRLGQSKQLVKINGETLLERTTRVALDVSINVWVVLGSNMQEHEKAIHQLPVVIVENAQWAKGIGHSLKTGAQQLLKFKPETTAILILVCDQPSLTSAHLRKLIEMAEVSDRKIIGSSYKNICGVPALFKKDLFEELKGVGDGEGARKIIQQRKVDVIAIDFPGGEWDIDTPEDLKKISP